MFISVFKEKYCDCSMFDKKLVKCNCSIERKEKISQTRSIGYLFYEAKQYKQNHLTEIINTCKQYRQFSLTHETSKLMIQFIGKLSKISLTLAHIPMNNLSLTLIVYTHDCNRNTTSGRHIID